MPVAGDGRICRLQATTVYAGCRCRPYIPVAGDGCGDAATSLMVEGAALFHPTIQTNFTISRIFSTTKIFSIPTIPSTYS
jgi:hypothetical protein